MVRGARSHAAQGLGINRGLMHVYDCADLVHQYCTAYANARGARGEQARGGAFAALSLDGALDGLLQRREELFALTKLLSATTRSTSLRPHLDHQRRFCYTSDPHTRYASWTRQRSAAAPSEARPMAAPAASAPAAARSKASAGVGGVGSLAPAPSDYEPPASWRLRRPSSRALTTRRTKGDDWWLARQQEASQPEAAPTRSKSGGSKSRRGGREAAPGAAPPAAAEAAVDSTTEVCYQRKLDLAKREHDEAVAALAAKRSSVGAPAVAAPAPSPSQEAQTQRQTLPTVARRPSWDSTKRQISELKQLLTSPSPSGGALARLLSIGDACERVSGLFDFFEVARAWLLLPSAACF